MLKFMGHELYFLRSITLNLYVRNAEEYITDNANQKPTTLYIGYCFLCMGILFLATSLITVLA